MANAVTSAPRREQGNRFRSRSIGKLIAQACWHVAVLACSAAAIAPLMWVVSTSLTQTGSEFEYPPRFIPNPIVWHNYEVALTILPFHLFFRNTVLIEIGNLSGTLITGTMVAFAFARLRYPGRDLWFMILISTMMLPDVVTLIPHYVIFKTLGWIDTLLPLTVPAWFGGYPFNIFLIRQFFMTIPLELDEAARIDGASSFWIYSRIMLPLSRPVLATVAILAFVYNWNDFLHPLIFLNSIPNLTLAIGLKLFVGQNAGYWNLMMAVAAAMTVPMLVMFITLQRYFTKGIVLTGLAGR